MKILIPTKKYNLWQSITTKWFMLAIILLNGQCLQASAGIPFKYFFKKGEVECTIEYMITGSFPIEIKRIYPDGSTELIVLQLAQPEYANAVYKLVSQSKSHLQAYMPDIVKNFGVSEQKARLYIKELNLLAPITGRLDLFVFFKGKKDDKLRLVGHIAYHSYGYYKPKSIDGMYWVGDPKHTQAKGIAGIAIQALFNHAIAIGVAEYVNLVMVKENIKSLKIAEALHMKKIDPKDYKKWGYSHKYDQVYAYSLSATAWKAKHWKKSK